MLCEKALGELERKAEVINNLGTLIMNALQKSPKPKPTLQRIFSEDKPEDIFLTRIRDEQKRRVLFKEHSFG